MNQFLSLAAEEAGIDKTLIATELSTNPPRLPIYSLNSINTRTSFSFLAIHIISSSIISCQLPLFTSSPLNLGSNLYATITAGLYKKLFHRYLALSIEYSTKSFGILLFNKMLFSIFRSVTKADHLLLIFI
ncbi:unnamed protein product [Rhizophagus irregularis]|nr:unnamed protein product [Rhizophagus irregularis]